MNDKPIIRTLATGLVLLAVTCASAADWPQFRGPARDGVSKETGLLRSWPDGGPEVLWSTTVGQGYAAPAIVGGRVYFNDYDEATSEFLVRCLDLADGKEIWRFKETRRIRPNHGITRSVPAVDGKTVFSLDPKATLHALDAATGVERWRKNFVEDYGSKIPPWYNGQNPLLGKDAVIVAPAGTDALVVALDKTTGEERWRTPNPEGWLLSHASPMPAKLGGVEQILFSVLQGTVGVSAADGKLLWHFPYKFNVSVSPSPVAVDGDRVFVTAAYDSGGAMFRVVRKGDAWTTEELFTHAPDSWNSECQTPILHDGHLFAVGKTRRGLFTCLDLDGKEVWTSDGHASFGLGSFVLADGMFIILDGDTGTLRLLEASTKEYRELASAKVLDGHDVWAPPALADGRLIVRDLEKMVCLKVK